jgi:hypothetical protein
MIERRANEERRNNGGQTRRPALTEGGVVMIERRANEERTYARRRKTKPNGRTETVQCRTAGAHVERNT